MTILVTVLQPTIVTLGSTAACEMSVVSRPKHDRSGCCEWGGGMG